jgi:hypothetical protein
MPLLLLVHAFAAAIVHPLLLSVQLRLSSLKEALCGVPLVMHLCMPLLLLVHLLLLPTAQQH